MEKEKKEKGGNEKSSTNKRFLPMVEMTTKRNQTSNKQIDSPENRLAMTERT
jgi:hypothetical protein